MVQEGELALTQPSLFSTSHEESADTLEIQPEPVYGLTLTPPPAPPETSLRSGGSLGISFILSFIFILVLIIALRFRNNFKCVGAIFRNLIETRTRQNVFNDTVRETSLIVLLNLLWCVCAGIIGFSWVYYLNPEFISWSDRSIGMLLGVAIAVVYALFMWGAYAVVGWIFSDKLHSELWVKGYSASQALMSPALLLTALIGICRPDTALSVVIVSSIVFVLCKIVFIWKGYRIFFTQISSWVLFLCYLCSLEIVPLFLCYRGANLLAEVL